jgi:hypothetical protein
LCGKVDQNPQSGIYGGTHGYRLQFIAGAAIFIIVNRRDVLNRSDVLAQPEFKSI